MPKVRSLPIKVFKKRVFRFKYFACLAALVFMVVKIIIRFAQPSPYPFEEGQTNVNGLLTDEEYRKIFRPSLSSARCKPESTTLVAINSATANLQRRQAIRATWSKWVRNGNQTILFFLSTPDDPFRRKEIELENYYYNDVVILSSTESYYLLTFKILAIMNWSLKNCANIRFLVKCDDDMFVNWPKLDRFLTDHQNQTNTIFGKPNRNSKPNRNPHSRWYMPEKLYASDYYPEFVDGPIYILSADLLPKLLNSTSEVKPLYLEDVYISGLLREQVGGKLVYLNELIRYRYYVVPIRCLSFSTFSHHQISANEQKDLFDHYASVPGQNKSIICSLLAFFL